MSHKVARIGDHGTGTCTQHMGSIGVTVTFTTGSPGTTSDGIAVVRVGDLGTASCGHTAQATQGSILLTADGIAIHLGGHAGIIIGGGSYTCDESTATLDSAS